MRKLFRLVLRIWWSPVRLVWRTGGDALAWRRRAEVAEALAAERHRTIEVLSAALQALTGAKAPTNGSRPLLPQEERSRAADQ
jgi:hypothetical protein